MQQTVIFGKKLFVLVSPEEEKLIDNSKKDIPLLNYEKLLRRKLVQHSKNESIKQNKKKESKKKKESRPELLAQNSILLPAGVTEEISEEEEEKILKEEVKNHPLFTNVHPTCLFLRGGEIFYQPKGWVHYVVNLVLSFSIACWAKELPNE